MRRLWTNLRDTLARSTARPHNRLNSPPSNWAAASCANTDSAGASNGVASLLATRDRALADGRAIDRTCRGHLTPDAEPATATLTSNSVWYGDFDGDGNRDAVVLLQAILGGSGEGFYAVPVRDVDGQVVQLGHAFLGDRLTVSGIALKKGLFEADIVPWGSDDGTTKAAAHVTKTFPVQLP